MKKILSFVLLLSFMTSTFEISAQFVDLGAGTSTNSQTGAAPINIYYRSMHYQVVYTQAEIIAAGGLPGGTISGLGWYVTGAPDNALPNYSIKMKHTSAPDASVYDGVGLTNQLTIPSHMPISGGYDVNTFSSNFVWNGADNILVDVCFDQVSAYTQSGQQRTYAGLSKYKRNDNSSQCSVPIGNNSTSFKPQVRFAMTGGAPLTCFQPTSLSASGVTATSADLSWTTGGSLVWLVEYGPVGSAPDTSFMVGPASSQTINNLTPATDYEYCIYDFCNVGDTSFAACGTFQTPCLSYIAPYFNDFETAQPNTTTPPTCWSNTSGGEPWIFRPSIGGSGSSPGYGVSNSVDHTTGSGIFTWIDASGGIGTNELISPTIDFSGLTQGIVGCWILSNNLNDGAQNTLSIEAFDGSAWVNIVTYSGNFADWQRVYGVIPNTIPTTTQFRLVQTTSIVGGSSYYNDLLIDDFFVEEAPTCFEPSNLDVSFTSATSAELSWTTGGASSWIVEYSPVGSSPGSEMFLNTLVNPVVVSGLVPGQEYVWMVQDSCGTNDISWQTPPNVFRMPPIVFCDSTNNFNYCHPDELMDTFTYHSVSGTSQMHFVFNSGVIGSFVDFTIYDGPDNTYPIVYSTFGGSNMAGFEFTSDTSIVTFIWNSQFANVCTSPLDFDVNCCVPTYNQENVFICQDSTFTLADGLVVSAQGAYSATIPNALGCDSIISYFVLELDDSTEVVDILCFGDTYMFPDGSSTTFSGQHSITTTNINGCDSTISYTLNLVDPTVSSYSVDICQGNTYVMPDGSVVSTDGNHTAVISNEAGCDSTITVSVNVHLPTTETPVSLTICQGFSYELPDGVVVSTSGTYTSMVVNVFGCPHEITTIITEDTTAFAEVVVEICGSETYTLLNGDIIDEAGEYNVNVNSTTGCDSIVTVYVSKCSAIGDLKTDGVVSVYPNPAKNFVTIELHKSVVNGTEFKIVNALGKTVYKLNNVNKDSFKVNLDNFSNGLYYIVLNDNESSILQKLVISK